MTEDQPDIDQPEIDRRAKRRVVINAVVAVALIGLGVHMVLTDVSDLELWPNRMNHYFRTVIPFMAAILAGLHSYQAWVLRNELHKSALAKAKRDAGKSWWQKLLYKYRNPADD